MFIKKLTSTKKGFSLIELMIVVAVIGILSTIASKQYKKMTQKVRETEALTHITTLFTCEKSFHSEWGVYYSGFLEVGYSPIGKQYFNTGFGDYGNVSRENLVDFLGYQKPVDQIDSTYNNSSWYCKFHPNECQLLEGFHSLDLGLDATSTIITNINQRGDAARMIIQSVGPNEDLTQTVNFYLNESKTLTKIYK
jgi:prepilin-type N-terminal cleavage/methylation domain-containing protein